MDAGQLRSGQSVKSSPPPKEHKRGRQTGQRTVIPETLDPLLLELMGRGLSATRIHEEVKKIHPEGQWHVRTTRVRVGQLKRQRAAIADATIRTAVEASIGGDLVYLDNLRASADEKALGYLNKDGSLPASPKKAMVWVALKRLSLDITKSKLAAAGLGEGGHQGGGVILLPREDTLPVVALPEGRTIEG